MKTKHGAHIATSRLTVTTSASAHNPSEAMANGLQNISLSINLLVYSSSSSSLTHRFGHSNCRLVALLPQGQC